MEKEFKRLAEKLCKDKACQIQYCLQGELNEYFTFVKLFTGVMTCGRRRYNNFPWLYWLGSTQ